MSFYEEFLEAKNNSTENQPDYITVRRSFPEPNEVLRETSHPISKAEKKLREELGPEWNETPPDRRSSSYRNRAGRDTVLNSYG